MFTQKISKLITNLRCSHPDHQIFFVQSICVSQNCEFNSRLMCTNCLNNHKSHSNYEECQLNDLEQLITRKLLSTNALTKQVTSLFESVKLKLMNLLTQIEQQLIESTKQGKQSGRVDEIINDIITTQQLDPIQINQLITQILQLQPHDEQIPMHEFSRIFLSYLEKFNKWLGSVPELKLEEQRINILKGQISAYGKPLSHKISKNDQLVSTITLFENCYLKGINFGQIEIIDKLQVNQEIRITILLGQNFKNIIHQESYRIIQNQYKNDLNFSKPIILMKNSCYTLAITSNQGTFAIKALTESGHLNSVLRYEREHDYINNKESDNIIPALYIVDLIIQLIKI